MYCVMRASAPSVYRRYDVILKPPAPSAPPTYVRVSEVTFSSITVHWEPVDCIQRNGDITGYSVQYGETSSAVGGETYTSVTHVTHVTISGLTPSTEYTVSVAAINIIDAGIFSGEVVQQTAGDYPKYFSYSLTFVNMHVDVLSVSVISSSATSLTISWSLADGLTATDYTISYSNTDCPLDIHDSIANSGPSQTIYNLTGLEEGSEYSITVTVTLSNGGTGKNSLTATTMTVG